MLGSGAEYGTQSARSTAGVTKLNPENLYAQQKVIAFDSAKEFLSESQVRLTWARVFQPYGPHQDKKRLLPYLIDSLKSGKSIHLVDTSSILDWITTRDLASAIAWIINNVTPMEVDIGTSIGFTNVELLKHLESLLGNSTQWTGQSQQTSTNYQVSLVGKDSPLFKSGWVPQDSLTSGLKWTLNL